MGLSDFVDGVKDRVGDTVGAVHQVVTDPVGTVSGVFDVGEASGNDHGSSNWAAWGHKEIRSMLDDSVDPADVEDGAWAWRELREHAAQLLRQSTADVQAIVSGGWRGESADATIRSLTPVDRWADTLTAAMEHTAQLMGHSGSAAGQAKATVPPAQSHDWGRSLGSFGLGGPVGLGIDAVAQDRAQEEARAEAVRIMNNVYSAPINDNTRVVPMVPQLADPTLQPPEPSPLSGPSSAGAGLAGAAVPGVGGGVSGGAGVRSTVAADLQGLPGQSGSPGGGEVGPGQLAGPGRSVSGAGFGGGGWGAGGHAPVGTAGVPFVPPVGGVVGTGADAERSRRGFRGAGAGGGRPGTGSGAAPGFGPRGSGGALGGGSEGRTGAGPVGGAGAASGAAGRGVVGGAPLVGAGAGRGPGGEDSEHRRPSYLIEMDDVFNDGRKVAPPVIGEDPPEHYR